MSLWTDGIFITENDLILIDREIKNVAATEDLPLSGSTGVIARGIAEAGLEILHEALMSFQSFYAPVGVPWNHYLAVMNTGSGSPYGNTARLHLSQVVVDIPQFGAWNAAKNFAVYYTLLTFYQSAQTRKEPDRYASKYARLEVDMEQKVRPWLYAAGIPVISNPLSCPGAIGVPSSGSWSKVNVSSGAGGANAAIQAIDVAITYTGATYSATDPTKNAESAPSAKVQFAIPGNALLTLDISSLNPPTGVQPFNERYLGTLSPMKATGWNIYVGTRGGKLYRQTDTPIPIATKTYAFTADPILSGVEVGLGQMPDLQFTISKTLMRA